MSLPATDDFTGTNAAAINGRTTTTGGLTWSGSGWEINGDRAYSPSGGKVVVDAGTADVVVSVKMVSGIGDSLILFRCNSARTAYLIVYVRSGDIRLFDESFNQIGTTFTGAVANNDVISVEANGTAIVVKQNGTTRITGTSSTYVTQTYVGMYGSGGEIYDDFSVSAFTVALPVATLTKADTTTVYLGATAGSGGSSPQWSRSTSPGSGFSNLSNGGGVSGATSYALMDGSVAPGTDYYYICTDSSGASNVQTGRTWKAPAYVLVVADSIWETSTGGNLGVGSPDLAFAAALKKAAGGERDVIIYNAALSGTHAYEWYDATSGTPVQSLLSTASANGISAGCTKAVVTLGVNDSFSAETTAEFQANITGICSYLLGQGYAQVVLNYPTGYAPSVDLTAYAKLLSLRSNIDAVVNGTTIVLGESLMIGYLPDHAATELQGSGTGVHLTATGLVSVGEASAWAWARAVGDTDTGGGGGSTGGFVIGG